MAGWTLPSQAEGRRLLLAGATGPERMPVRHHREDADWFKPLHIRDEHAARERIAAQIAAGADVVIAPTWLTHRRALLPLGETRRAAEWTAAAVRLARDAVEVGLERRDEALADAPQDDPRRQRPVPLVAAALPALDDGAEQEHGQLLPREAATERDYRDQAGILSDAMPDLLLVEGQPDEAEARLAMTEAAQTGLPVWTVLNTSCLASVDLEEWLDRASQGGVERLLLPPPLERLAGAANASLPWGGVDVAATAVADWLDAGADVIGRLDGATTAALEPLRSAIDAHEEVELRADQAARSRWTDLVAEAAAMAPGGAAVIIDGHGTDSLPAGFEWIAVDAAERRLLPNGHFRLVVSTDAGPDLGRLLERGGILAQPLADPTGSSPLRLVRVNDLGDPALAIYRRED